MDIKDYIKEKIQKSIDISDTEIIIDIPKDKKNGDYSSNIALKLTKILKDNPMNIANKIVENIKCDDILEKIEIASPGFINFYTSKKYLLENINKVLEEKENYGSSKESKNLKINLEYVSANPTGILHLGHARGASYGDSLARIYKFAGYDVTREYYINDAGNQMYNLGVSIKERYKELCGINFELPENGYHGKEIIDIAKNIYEEFQDTKLEEDIPFFKKYGLNILLSKIKKDLADFNVEFDVWSSEQSIYDRNEVKNALNKLIEDNRTYESDDAIWLKTSEYGDEKDRVLVKNDGTYTYLLPDIAYHNDKYKRNYDNIIDVLGADHHGYIPRLKASMEMLGNDSNKLDVKILQMVRLIQDGKEVKMSKRTGNAITIRELMEEVGVDATRYFYIMRSLDTQMDFDMDLATKKTNENPVYYVQYAHARICSILRDAESKNLKASTCFETIESEEAYDILKKIYEFNTVVENSASKKLPHLITNYVYDLAGLFHTYYSKEKILTDNKKYSEERIALITAVKITISNALSLIGVSSPEKM